MRYCQTVGQSTTLKKPAPSVSVAPPVTDSLNELVVVFERPRLQEGTVLGNMHDHWLLIVHYAGRRKQSVQQEAQLMLTNPREAFRGQSRSPNMVPFGRLGMVSY